MEIRMVKCRRCGTVYNEAVKGGCPSCAGQNIGQSGFSSTVMPNNGWNSRAQTNSGFAPTGQPRGFTPTAQPGGFAPTGKPGGFTPTGQPNSGVFSKTAPPSSGESNGASGFFSKTQPPKDDRFVHTKYVGEDTTTKETMRVTGWIVAVNGPSKGKDFRLHAGYNYIGKEQGDIRIEGDDYVSREKDSQIYCDLISGNFYASHVNGVNAIRVNNEPVISGSTKLQAYDILTIGKTQFVFVPLCGSQFNWG